MNVQTQAEWEARRDDLKVQRAAAAETLKIAERRVREIQARKPTCCGSRSRKPFRA